MPVMWIFGFSAREISRANLELQETEVRIGRYLLVYGACPGRLGIIPFINAALRS